MADRPFWRIVVRHPPTSIAEENDQLAGWQHRFSFSATLRAGPWRS